MCLKPGADSCLNSWGPIEMCLKMNCDSKPVTLPSAHTNQQYRPEGSCCVHASWTHLHQQCFAIYISPPSISSSFSHVDCIHIWRTFQQHVLLAARSLDWTLQTCMLLGHFLNSYCPSWEMEPTVLPVCRDHVTDPWLLGYAWVIVLGFSSLQELLLLAVPYWIPPQKAPWLK